MHSSALHTEPRPVLPNFLVVGAAKCGTTSLYYYLDQHPEIYMSPVKEPKFFSARADNPGTGPGDALLVQSVVGSFEEYGALFHNGIGRKAIGEASTDTFFRHERSIPAIQKHLGDPHIIIILRDPVKRAYSAYNFLLQYGRETLSFREALAAEEQRKRDGYAFMWQYREGGLYADGVRAFQKNFSRVQVLLYDDLKNDASALIRSVYAFLGVSPGFAPDMQHLHNASGVPRGPVQKALFTIPKPLHRAARAVGGALMGADRWARLRDNVRATLLRKPAPMDADIERELRRFYREDILQLQGTINRDLSAWLESRT